LTEPDVALTDYAVAIECFAFTWILFRAAAPRRALHRLFVVFFASVGIGALIGGTAHGFFPDEDGIAGALLWRLTLLALGVSTFAAWSIGGRLLFSERTARIVQTAAGFECAAYALVVLAVDQQFRIAIANYAPSVVFLGAAFLVRNWRTPHRAYMSGLLGVVLTIVAALVQQRQIAFSSLYLNHNAVYHLIQMAALGLIFLAGRHVNPS
jgi:hypothetical protein